MEKTIKVRSSEEIKAMTAENTAITIALRERFIFLSNMINVLKEEKDKIQEIVLDKYGHAPVKNGEIFKAVVYDVMTIDEKKLVELYGADALEKTKTKPKHIEFIKA